MPSAAPPQADVAGPPRTELEELQIRANQVTDDVSFFTYIPIKLFKFTNLSFVISYATSTSSHWIVLGECWPFAKR